MKTTKNRFTLLIIIAAGFVTTVGAGAQRSQSQYDVKISHIGDRAVAVSCKDGADPTVDMVLTKAVGTIVISCGVK